MKYIKIAGLTTIVVIALAVLGVTLAFAQQPTQEDSPSWWQTMNNMMQGSRMMGGRSMQEMHNQMTQNGGMAAMHKQMHQDGGMGAMHEWMHQSGGVHEAVWKAIAEKLGLTAEELTAQFESGKTLAEIAQERGVSTSDLAATMESAMKAGLEQAVQEGALTQEQADLMLQHMDGQYEWMIENMSEGMMGAGPGMMGPGSNRMGPGVGGCHDTNQPSEDNNSL